MKRYFMVLYDIYKNTYSRKFACGGISRHHLSLMEFNEYAKGLFKNPGTQVDEYRIKSRQQQMYTVKISKIFLNNLYLHRRVLSCGIHTLPYGYLFNQDNNCPCDGFRDNLQI